MEQSAIACEPYMAAAIAAKSLGVGMGVIGLSGSILPGGVNGGAGGREATALEAAACWSASMAAA